MLQMPIRKLGRDFFLQLLPVAQISEQQIKLHFLSCISYLMRQNTPKHQRTWEQEEPEFNNKE